MRFSVYSVTILLLFCLLVYHRSGLSALPGHFSDSSSDAPVITVLGIAQDGGFPHAGCKKSCCREVWDHPEKHKMVSCLGLADPLSKQFWLFDATPNFKTQLYRMSEKYPDYHFAGIFLTHAHIGHYTGLMQLGREVMGAKEIPVYAMSRMKKFLENNGPWSQLVNLNNIKLISMQSDSSLQLGLNLTVTPFPVPHRDEYSETVGFRIQYRNYTVLFIPDINKWEAWSTDIKSLVGRSDLAFLDGTFYRNGEIPGRDMKDIPHPFIEESMKLFENLSATDKGKICFIHLNHTNPLLYENNEERTYLYNKGFCLAQEGREYMLHKP